MNNNSLSTYINDFKDRLKVLFGDHKNPEYIEYNFHILSQRGTDCKFLQAHGFDDTVELHEGTIYYYSNSVIHNIEFSELLNADIDYMFNMYLMLSTEVFSTLVYIQYHFEYYNVNKNRLYAPYNIHMYLTDFI